MKKETKKKLKAGLVTAVAAVMIGQIVPINLVDADYSSSKTVVCDNDGCNHCNVICPHCDDCNLNTSCAVRG